MPSKFKSKDESSPAIQIINNRSSLPPVPPLSPIKKGHYHYLIKEQESAIKEIYSTSSSHLHHHLHHQPSHQAYNHHSSISCKDDDDILFHSPSTSPSFHSPSASCKRNDDTHDFQFHYQNHYYPSSLSCRKNDLLFKIPLFSNSLDDLNNIKIIRKIHQIREMEYVPLTAIFLVNPDLHPSMRCKLINWLIEVVLHFRLHKNTFYLAVYLMDRYLSLMTLVKREELQLIGITSMLIASKLEEIYPPKLKDFSEICDGSCPNWMIAQKELDILIVINWQLAVPTPSYWLGCYLKILESFLPAGAIEELFDSSLELIDMAIHMPNCLLYSYSLLAASALYIRLNQDKLIRIGTGFEVATLKQCSDWLWGFFNAPGPLYFFPVNEELTDDTFDYIVQNNSRIMEYLLLQIKINK